MNACHGRLERYVDGWTGSSLLSTLDCADMVSPHLVGSPTREPCQVQLPACARHVTGQRRSRSGLGPIPSLLRNSGACSSDCQSAHWNLPGEADPRYIATVGLWGCGRDQRGQQYVTGSPERLPGSFIPKRERAFAQCDASVDGRSARLRPRPSLGLVCRPAGPAARGIDDPTANLPLPMCWPSLEVHRTHRRDSESGADDRQQTYRHLAERLRAAYTFGQLMTGNSEFAAASEAEFSEAGMPVLRHVYDRDPVPMPLARAAGDDGHTGQQYRRSAASGSKPSRRAECPGVSGLDTFVLSAGLGRFTAPARRAVPLHDRGQPPLPLRDLPLLDAQTDGFGD